MRARHRLSKLLPRHDVRFDGTARAWTTRHRDWLGRVNLGRPAQLTLLDYLGAIDALIVRRDTLERHIEQLVPDSPWAQTVARLRCLRGIDTLSAVGLCAEIGDFARSSVASRPADELLGLVPSEHSSGERRAQGQITKAGSRHARRLLVEAAWHYVGRPGAVRHSLAASPRTCSRSPGRPSSAYTTPGGAWITTAASGARSSPSPARASWPASAGRSPPPTDPPPNTTSVKEAAGPPATAREHPRKRCKHPPR
ncbi:MAG: transposase [Solirubrobacteraceae bacterium]